MKSSLYKTIELLIIFILIPVSFALDYSPKVKGVIGLLGFVYIIYVLLKVEELKFKIAQYLKWKRFWKEVLLKFTILTRGAFRLS